MKVGDLIQSRWDEEREFYGIGMIIDRCEDNMCEQHVHVHAHWIMHFPNRKNKTSTADFIHSGPSRDREKQFKWVLAA